MKLKIIFILSLAGMAFAGCNSNSRTDQVTDSAIVDTIMPVDSVIVDTTAVRDTLLTDTL
ncbi:MAG: hypothetical protein ACO1NS_03445 [Daejeonella sp.]